MPFPKGNSLWRKGIEAKKEKKEMMDEFFGIIASGGISKYAGKLEGLSDGEELSKPEESFMNRMEFWAEFVKPKLGRTETKVEIEGIGFLLGIKNINDQ